MRPHGIIGALCCLAGVILLGLGGLMPAHIRAFDQVLLAEVGTGSPKLVDIALQAVGEGRFGTVARLYEARSGVTNAVGGRVEGGKAAAGGWEQVGKALATRPVPDRWGSDVAWLDREVGDLVAGKGSEGTIPALEWALPEAVRSTLLKSLSASTHPTVMALIGCRKLERTEIFPAVSTAAGQPFETVLLIAAALAENGRVHPGLSIAWERLATSAVQGRGSMGLERAMLELLSAARRLEWDSLATLAERCEDTSTLEILMTAAGTEGRNWGLVLGLLLANQGGASLAAHLRQHGDLGMSDLREALAMGGAAVQKVTTFGLRIHRPVLRIKAVQGLGLSSVSAWLGKATGRVPQLALAMKYLLWIDGLFLVFLGLWHGRRSFLDEANRRFDPRPDYKILLVAALASGVLLFLTAEQYLALARPAASAQSQPWRPIFRARLRAELPKPTTKAMNEKMIAMLVAFFVIQMSIYLIGLARLRHLRARLVEATVKLKLLDNEETLFDAPLYMGIAGSVLALVLRLSGYEGVSLMASYSSTLFGILFCFVLKVMHVRPYRQRLILESSEPPSA